MNPWEANWGGAAPAASPPWEANWSAAQGAREGKDVSGPTLASEAVSGLPVIGAWEPTAGASFQAATHPWLGLGSDAPTYEQRRAENIARHQARQSTFEEKHPNEATLARLGGGFLGNAALASAAPELFGIRGLFGLGGYGGTAERMIGGALGQSGLSAADAWARGQPVGDAAKLGGIVGAAVPGATIAAGNIARNYPEALKFATKWGPALGGLLTGAHFSPEEMIGGAWGGGAVGGAAGRSIGEGASQALDRLLIYLGKTPPADTFGRFGSPFTWSYPAAPAIANQYQNMQPVPAWASQLVPTGRPQVQVPYGAQ